MRLLLTVCFLFLPAFARADDGPTVVKLTVPPQLAPVPPLKYRLLPALEELHPGSAVQNYYKTWASETWNWTLRDDIPEKLPKWLDTPLAELPVDEIPVPRTAFEQLDFAARCTTVDWQMLAAMRSGGFGTLLPDLQPLRETASWLRLRARVAVKRGDFPAAIEALKTATALAHHLGEHPTLIGNLVGMAIARANLDTVEEMLQQEGCPNLYWALTALPDPLTNIRRGIEGEPMMVRIEFADMIDTDRIWSAEDEAEHLTTLRRLYELVSTEQVEGSPIRGWLAAQAENAEALTAARGMLSRAGVGKDLLGRMRPAQLLVTAGYFQYRDYMDRFEAMLALPYPQVESDLLMMESQLRPGEGGNALRGKSNPDSFLLSLLPTPTKIRWSQLRTQQRIGLLRCVEAVRLHAAAHDGELPASLGDLNVPVPTDPATGQPYLYAVDGDRAVIRNTPPVGKQGVADFEFRYEVRLRK